MNSLYRTILGLLAATVVFSSVGSDNWPQYRGLAGRGISPTDAPAIWNVETGQNIRWTREIPGLGHAAPILWEDRLYIATAERPGAKPEIKIGIYGDGDSYQEKQPHVWRLLCLDRTSGQVLWNRVGHEAVPREERHTKASHCNSTPATDGHHLVAIFGSEGLFCFDMEGALRWKKDLGRMDARPWNATNLQWGFASSPLLYDGRIVVQCDVASEPFVAVYDASDGREIWRTARKEVGNWCTPAVARDQNRLQVIVNGWKQQGGYDFTTGRSVWTLSDGGDIPVPAPLIVGDLAFFTSAHGKYRPLRAVRWTTAAGNITPSDMTSTNAAVAWCHPKLGSYMQTPIVLGDTLWSCDWLGILSCVDATTGAVQYSERLGSGGQAFTASGIAAGKHLYFTSETGDVYVVEALRKFSVTATNQLGGLCLATPAASEGTLYFRTTDRVIAVGR